VLVAGVTLYLTLFIGVSTFLFPYATAKTLIIRAAGSAAFLLLHIVLCIGPLCRLDPKFLPLLYNRRHLERKYDVPLTEAEYKLDAVPAETEVAAALKVKVSRITVRRAILRSAVGRQPLGRRRLSRLRGPFRRVNKEESHAGLA
jgi:hypothetical protein